METKTPQKGLISRIVESVNVLPVTSSFVFLNGFIALEEIVILSKWMDEGKPLELGLGAFGVNLYCTLHFINKMRWKMNMYREVESQIKKEGYSEQVLENAAPTGGFAERYASVNGELDEFNRKFSEFMGKNYEPTESKKRLLPRNIGYR